MMNQSNHIEIESSVDTELQHEMKHSKNVNTVHVFHDIVDEKHERYMKSYHENTSLFWGIGIENESYLMLKKPLYNSKDFATLSLKSERYSVNYFNNFKSEPLIDCIKKLYTCKKLTYPNYINAHTFDKTDKQQRHRTTYQEIPQPNPAFTESIHSALLRESRLYKSMYDTSLVFDGDSIEFITQRFCNTTVSDCIKELVTIKQSFLNEVSPFFQKWGIGPIEYPHHNYGITTFLSSANKHLALCNNGTYHINLTLPTLLQNGTIVDKPAFVRQHLQLIKCIQMVEPLIVACYGTPDVLALTDQTNSMKYSMGSLRVTLSRYISLQTFDTEQPVNGKLLLMKKSNDPSRWYNQLEDTPYQMNQEIGADINFNKFKNHGIEIRFLDWFPEEYLAGLMNFFVLLAQHSLCLPSVSLDIIPYQNLIKNCVTKGCAYLLPVEESNLILHDLHLEPVDKEMSAFYLLLHISAVLYGKYHNGPIVQQMSPRMTNPVIVNYNWMAYQQLYRDVYGKPDLILRAEENPLDARTTIIPDHVKALLPYFTVLVESSPTRCFTDEDYRLKGAVIVKKDSWIASQDSYVIGLKGTIHPLSKRQTHLHFAHCFKGQPKYQITLGKLSSSVFIDYEYMLDKEKKRAVSFCKQSGKIGCYLALMTYYKRLQKKDKKAITVIPEFNETIYSEMLERLSAYHRPKVLLIGYGVVGKSCKEVLDRFEMNCTILTSKDTLSKEKMLKHDILIHATSLSPVTYPPFLLPADLQPSKVIHKPADLYDPVHLSVICDISCDVGNPHNLLPIYDTYTTKEQPIAPLSYQPSIDLIAIPNLPSLEPILSSTQFSSTLLPFLPELLYFHHAHPIREKAGILFHSYQKFRRMIE
jgi:alanine dehydrogenase